VRLSSRVVLEVALGQSLAGDMLADAVCRGGGVVGLGRIAITPSLPVVAVGAPACVYYREVGRRLDADIVIPEHFEVANAVGAATGVVAHTAVVEVTGDGSGRFRVLGASGAQSFEGAAAALEFAERRPASRPPRRCSRWAPRHRKSASPPNSGCCRTTACCTPRSPRRPSAARSSPVNHNRQPGVYDCGLASAGSGKGPVMAWMITKESGAVAFSDWLVEEASPVSAERQALVEAFRAHPPISLKLTFHAPPDPSNWLPPILRPRRAQRFRPGRARPMTPCSTACR
jgi:hypothetical protein